MVKELVENELEFGDDHSDKDWTLISSLNAEVYALGLQICMLRDRALEIDDGADEIAAGFRILISHLGQIDLLIDEMERHFVLVGPNAGASVHAHEGPLQSLVRWLWPH
jgi:hypothetical protein